MSRSIYQTKEKEDKKTSSFDSSTQQGKTSQTFVDNRPENVTQRKLQESANQSQQVKQLMSYQQMANNGNTASIQAKQEEEETLQSKLKVTPSKEYDTAQLKGNGEGVVQMVGDPNAIALNNYDASDDGSTKTAEMRTNGALNGSAPYQDPAGYSYIRAQGLTNYWIRFHLVNEEAGGDGAAWNLVPASKIDNGQYHSDYEVNLKNSVDLALNDTKNKKEVYYGVELSYLPAPAAMTTMTDQATPYFPHSMRVWHKTSKDNGASWSNVANGSTFNFQGKDGHQVPPDTTGNFELSNPMHEDSIKTLLRNGGIFDPDDMYDWLVSNSNDVANMNGDAPEDVENVLGFEDFNSNRTLEQVANGEGEGEGLINLSRMIALGKIGK